MEEKHFKEKLHFSNSLPKITEGGIRWCSCGENIGIEINGKNDMDKIKNAIQIFLK